MDVCLPTNGIFSLFRLLHVINFRNRGVSLSETVVETSTGILNGGTTPSDVEGLTTFLTLGPKPYKEWFLAQSLCSVPFESRGRVLYVCVFLLWKRT